LEFVGEFGEFAAAGHCAGEFLEGGFLAGLVQQPAAETGSGSSTSYV
jgi:hypothetical protein